MRVLGIETSCDETGVALYDGKRGLLGHALHSQARLGAWQPISQLRFFQTSRLNSFSKSY